MTETFIVHFIKVLISKLASTKPIMKMYFKRRDMQDTCTGEMASRVLVLGARPFGITPGGGCRALFITLLQLATIVRIVSDNSWDTLLRI